MAKVTIKSAMLNGIEVVPVGVEVAVTQDLPGFSVIGMVDVAVLEARERVKCAVKSVGFTWPDGKILVNLAPVTLKKRGSGFDLAIAVGILVATGQISPAHAEKTFVGELRLNGEVLPVRGSACYADHARQTGTEVVLSASAGIDSADWDSAAVGIGNLADLRQVAVYLPLHDETKGDYTLMGDFAEINGYATAKRACQVAAAGKLGLLLVGAPGAGKSMLAARIPSILPELTAEEESERARIWSAIDQHPLVSAAHWRVLRSPHHSVTGRGLIGGGNPVLPGEVTLAHNGVLFLDDIAEFSPSILQRLRQPVEERKVTIARADGVTEFPADFMLVAGANPCPCGNFGGERNCTCSAEQVLRYQSRLCGPIGDKLHMSADVKADLLTREETASSAELREGVERAWEFRAWREGQGDASASGRAWESVSNILRSCRMADGDYDLFEKHVADGAYSGREIVNALMIARAIADIEQSEAVSRDHLLEALAFRNSYVK